MNPEPTPATAAPSAAPQTRPARRLRPARRPIGWLVLQWAAVLSVAAVVLGAIGVWFAFRPHLMARSYLQMKGLQVNWILDADTWRRGGVTEAAVGPGVGGWSLHPVDLEHLASLHNLEVLDMTGWSGGGGGDLGFLRGLAGLKVLRLLVQEHPGYTTGPDVDDAGLAPVAALAGLEELSLLNLKITDAGLAHLTGLKTLRTLDLAGTEITDAGLETLRALPDLEVLDLSNTAVTDAGLETLARMPNLRALSLEGTRVTVEGLAGFDRLSPTAPQIAVFPRIGAVEP